MPGKDIREGTIFSLYYVLEKQKVLLEVFFDHQEVKKQNTKKSLVDMNKGATNITS